MSDLYDLSEILQAIHTSTLEIADFIEDTNAEQFFADLQAQRAVMFDLVIIGEACRDIERYFPEILE